jgi:hypothetical protein
MINWDQPEKYMVIVSKMFKENTVNSVKCDHFKSKHKWSL